VSQAPLQGGYTFDPTINAANNHITTSGFAYDAAGNMTNDSFHTYTYDAEGNITKVDSGSTAQYVYDAFNRRVHVQTASATNEYVYDYGGRRVSTWLSPSNYGSEGRIYWGGQQFAYRSTDGTTYFDHPDMLGTERMRTSYAGSAGSSYISLPWGDGYTATVNASGSDQDNEHYAGLERDAESGTEHAQFRNYASAQGRWLSPDPYMGSYDLTNPQSMNRYAYGLNNPTSMLDPSGLDDCEGADGCNGDGGGGDSGGGDGGGGVDCGADDTVCVNGGPSDPGDPTNPNPANPGVPGEGPQGGGGHAPNNASNCSVLTTPCKQPSKLLKYVTFLGCELNSDIEQLTDEEDAQHANQVPIVFSAMATIGGLTGKVPGWAGITGAVTGGIYTIGIAAKSNQECTGSVYGH
jgi:RHS repeat-associated protein